MENEVAKFRTHADAQRADREFYHSLTPQERLNALLGLVERGNADAPRRLERVHRVTRLEP